MHTEHCKSHAGVNPLPARGVLPLGVLLVQQTWQMQTPTSSEGLEHLDPLKAVEGNSWMSPTHFRCLSFDSKGLLTDRHVCIYIYVYTYTTRIKRTLRARTGLRNNKSEICYSRYITPGILLQIYYGR